MERFQEFSEKCHKHFGNNIRFLKKNILQTYLQKFLGKFSRTSGQIFKKFLGKRFSEFIRKNILKAERTVKHF